ncbi:MAG: hypothetical protein WKG07_19235 [Hymenobacter sp.]
MNKALAYCAAGPGQRCSGPRPGQGENQTKTNARPHRALPQRQRLPRTETDWSAKYAEQVSAPSACARTWPCWRRTSTRAAKPA